MMENTSENNKLKLMEYPLVNVCPRTEKQGFDQLESLLSSSYSRVITRQQLESDLISFSKNSILATILNAVAISSNNRPLTIELVEGKMNEYYLDSTAIGFAQAYYNRIVISENKEFTLNKETFMHELAHKAMMVIFKNDSNPYKNDEQKKKYLKAINDVFLKSAQHIKQHHKLSIQVNNDESHPYQIAENLSDLVFGGVFNKLIKGKYDEVISVFKKNPEMDINDIKVLNGFNCIESSIFIGDFKQVKKLAEVGAYTNKDTSHLLEYGLKAAISNNNIESIKSAIEIKSKLNSKELEAFKEALKTAQNLNNTEIVEILKPYIESNDTWYNYFAGFIPTITVEMKDDAQKPSSNTLDAIRIFLNPIFESYAEEKYDCEFIASFIAIITNHSDNQEVLDIVQPITNYFENVINEEFLQYQHTSDKTMFCALTFEYGYVE